MCTPAQVLFFAWAPVSRNINQKHLIHTTAHSRKLGKPSHKARDITIQSLLGIKVAHMLLAQPNECPALHSHTGKLEPNGFQRKPHHGETNYREEEPLRDLEL